MCKVNFELTKNEKQILDTLWKTNKPLTSGEIVELTINKTWKASSIHIILNRLLEKKAIKLDGEIKKGIVTARLYSPALSQDDYEVMEISNNTQKINANNINLIKAYASLTKHEDMDEDSLNELEDLLNEIIKRK